MELPRIPQRTTTGFAFSMVDRAIKEGIARRQFTKAKAKEVLDFFDTDPTECVFCGSTDVKRWDHLLPISDGGETVLGNMVPACSMCDDSKGKRYFREWINSNAKCSPNNRNIKDIKRRIKRIEAYMRHFDYTPRDVEHGLNQSEKKRLKQIRQRVQEARNDIELFIKEYRQRNAYD